MLLSPYSYKNNIMEQYTNLVKINKENGYLSWSSKGPINIKQSN